MYVIMTYICVSARNVWVSLEGKVWAAGHSLRCSSASKNQISISGVFATLTVWLFQQAAGRCYGRCQLQSLWISNHTEQPSLFPPGRMSLEYQIEKLENTDIYRSGNLIWHNSNYHIIFSSPSGISRVWIKKKAKMPCSWRIWRTSLMAWNRFWQSM